MKQLFILIATLVSLTIQGQNKNPAQKIIIGFNFSPDYSFRKLNNTDGSSSSDLVIKSRNDLETPKFGFTTGLTVIFSLTGQIGLETGVHYSNKGYKILNRDLVYFPPNPSLPSKVKTNYSYNYIGIPVKAKFTFGKNKIYFITSAGFMTNFLLNVKQLSTYQYSDGRTEEKSQSTESGFNKIDISPMISIGIGYRASGKLHLRAEPIFSYGIIKTKDAPVSEKLWSAGVNIGVYYELK